MLDNFAAGGAAINQICAAYGLGFKVFDLALDLPTGDIATEPAMDERGCVATMAFGMEAVAGGTDLLCVGEMGIGNTTVAAAIYAALYGGPAEHWVGRGTGVDDAGLARKVGAVEAALERHRPDLSDPLQILARLGGREVAAIAGAIVAARLQRVPVILDGYVATAAAAVLHAVDRASDRPLPRRAPVGRGRPSGRAGAPRQRPAPRPRDASRGGLGRGARGRPRQGGGGLPPRHGDLRPGGRVGAGRGVSGPRDGRTQPARAAKPSGQAGRCFL